MSANRKKMSNIEVGKKNGVNVSVHNMDIIYLSHYKDIPYIEVKNEDDAGIDLRAAIPHDITLHSGYDAIIPTGIRVDMASCNFHMYNALGLGVYGLVVPRSGLGFKHYVRLANTNGIIDASYQGEIMVKIRNESPSNTPPIVIRRGDRMCQIIFSLYLKGIDFNEVDEFHSVTVRGDKGFGDSGVV